MWRSIGRTCCTYVLYLSFVCVKVASDRGVVPTATVAANLYPQHIILQLPTPIRSSQIRSQIQAVQHSSNSSNVLVVLDFTAASAAAGGVVVDVPITVKQGQGLVIATAAALQAVAAAAVVAGSAAAAAADEGGWQQQLDVQPERLPVQCKASTTGRFLAASAAVSLELLGLSVQGCKGTAVAVKGAGSLQLKYMEFAHNNHGMQEVAGGAVLAVDVQQVLLHAVSCSYNYAELNGGCLRAMRVREVLVRDSSFTYNTRHSADAEGGGGALSVEFVELLKLQGCGFAHNTADGSNSNGGALAATRSGRVDVRQCSFFNNSAELHGGAISGEAVKNMTVSDSKFTRNGFFRLSAEELRKYDGFPFVFGGGGVYADGYQPVVLQVHGCRFTDNAAESGGGIAVTQWGFESGYLEVHDCWFERNEADLGASIFMNENMGSRVKVNNCTFLNNRGKFCAGAMAIYDSDAFVTNCAIAGNSAESEGGAMHVETEWAAGSGKSMLIINTTFTNNTAGVIGGALVTNGQSLLLHNTTFIANSAEEGAGAVSVLGGHQVTLSHVQLLQNHARSGVGGGLRVNTAASIMLQDAAVANNQGAEGAGLHLQSIAHAYFSNVSITSNAASRTGGGLVLLRAENATMRNCSISRNVALLGAGLAADSSSIAFHGVNFSGNTAGLHVASAVGSVQDAESDGSLAFESSDTSETAADAAVDVLQFASMVYAAGSAGAMLLQRSALNIGHGSLVSNTAVWDAGAVLMQQPGGFNISSTSFRSNVAQIGSGGGLVMRGGGPAVATGWLVECNFDNNSAAAGSGGAAIYDPGIGVLEVHYEQCNFVGNSAALDGGGIAATAATTLNCLNCTASSNSAGRKGGWLACMGCRRVYLQSGSSSGNAAAATGGAVSCTSCGVFESVASRFTSNSATDGGAVAVQSAEQVAVQGCSFEGNTAVQSQAAAADPEPPQLELLRQLPPAWQGLYPVTTAGSSSSSGGGSGSDVDGGAGGGLLVSGASSALLTDNILTGNTGSIGGAVYAAVADVCLNAAPQQPSLSSSSTGSSNCQLRLFNTSATDNCARFAGGVLYTSTPQALQLTSGGGSSSSSSSPEKGTTALLQKLAADNSSAGGCNSSSSSRADGYGPGAASSPVRLSLLRSDQMGTLDYAITRSESGAGRFISVQQQQQQTEMKPEAVDGGHGRKLLQSTRASILDQLAISSDNTIQASREAIDATAADVALDPWCPPLGATILDADLVAIDSSQVFSLPVYSLDIFGLQVTQGPGSDWAVALQQPHLLVPGSSSSSSVASEARVQLLSAARGRLVSGGLLLEGLSIAAPAGSDLTSALSARPMDPSAAQQLLQPVLSTNITIRVRPCLPGQTAVFSSSSSSSNALTAEMCYLCAAPSFSFTAYVNSTSGATSLSGDRSSSSSSSSRDQSLFSSSSAAAGACQPCPAGGLCTAGMVLPLQGYYQPHPRSAQIRLCPHVAACSREASAVANLQAYQCAMRRVVDAEAIPARQYTALQCSQGYWGPFCSCCYRPGRNTWLSNPSQTGFDLQQQQQQQHGYNIASQGILLPKPQKFDQHAAYGRRSGRCSRCPHILLAWVGFLFARTLDLVFVGLLALLWLLLGVLVNSPAAEALERLKQQQTRDSNIRFGDHMLMSRVSTTLRHASSELLHHSSLLLGGPRSNIRRQIAAAATATAAASPRNGTSQWDNSSASIKARSSCSSFDRNRRGTTKTLPAEHGGLLHVVPQPGSTTAEHRRHVPEGPQVAGPLHITASAPMTKQQQQQQHQLAPVLSSGLVQAKLSSMQLFQQQQQQQQQQLYPAVNSSLENENNTLASPLATQLSLDADVLRSPFATAVTNREQHAQQQQQQRQQQELMPASSVCGRSVGSSVLASQVATSTQPSSVATVLQLPLEVPAVTCQQQQQQQQEEELVMLMGSVSAADVSSTAAMSLAQQSSFAANILHSPFAAPAVNREQQQQQEGLTLVDSVSAADAESKAAISLAPQSSFTANLLHSPFAAPAVNCQQQQQQQCINAGIALLPPCGALTANQLLHVPCTQMQQQQQQPQLQWQHRQRWCPQQVLLPSSGNGPASATSPPLLLPHTAHSGVSFSPPSSQTLTPNPTLPGALLPAGHLTSPLSITYSTAINLFDHQPPPPQQQQQRAGAAGSRAGSSRPAAAAAARQPGEAVPAHQLALLLIAVRHLTCMVQVLLDGVQVAAVLLAQDLMYRAPDWTAVGLSAVLITQASTWQWVAFECLMPAGATASGAAVQAITVMMLPGIYTAVLLLLWIKLRSINSSCIAPCSSSSSSDSGSKAAQQQQQQHQRDIPARHSAVAGCSSNHALQMATAAAATAIAAAAVADSSMSPALSSSSALPVSPCITTQMAPEATTHCPSDALLADVLPQQDQSRPQTLDQTGAVHVGAEQLQNDKSPVAGDSPFMYAYQECANISMTGSYAGMNHGHAAAAAKPRICAWLRQIWLLITPQMHNTRALFVSTLVASLAYCYGLYSHTVASAFSCMSLGGKPTVPGEVHLTARVWVPDMQLQCYTGQHMAVAAVAAFLGTPVIAVYWGLLLLLAMPDDGQSSYQGDMQGSRDSSSTQAAAAAAAAAPSNAAAALATVWQANTSGGTMLYSRYAAWRKTLAVQAQRLRASLVVAISPLVRLLKACQRLVASKPGVDASHCVGLGVWNQQHRWWWLTAREVAKLAVFIAVVVNSMKASYVQAPMVLLVVLLVAMLTWQLQPGCSTSMNWLLYIMYCLWQLLALLMLVLAIPGMNGAAFGGVLLVLVCGVILHAAATVASLMWRCVSTASQLSLAEAQTAGDQFK